MCSIDGEKISLGTILLTGNLLLGAPILMRLVFWS